MRQELQLIRVNGAEFAPPDHATTLLDALGAVGFGSVKNGCAPQGQCGCCTVWVDGQPRLACVTPLSRVAGRSITTLEGLPTAGEWAQRFLDAGASQCGFCTPGIIMRLAAVPNPTPAAVRQALLAHQCRCTGWQTIVETALGAPGADHSAPRSPGSGDEGCGDDGCGGRDRRRDLAAATRRATIEGHAAQTVSADVPLGRCNAVPTSSPPPGTPGRRSTVGLRWPIDVPPGEWAYTLQTTWVDPAALELGVTSNGGAFGPKATSTTREDSTRHTPKRPPLALGVDRHGHGIVHVARTPGIAAAIHSVAPEWTVVEVDIPGPPTSAEVRAAGWAEVAAVRAAMQPGETATVTSPSGATARARFDHGTLHVEVDAGAPLDHTVLRSYCIGAAVMALGWVRSEGLVVDADGTVLDLTMRSFGLLRAGDVPHIDVSIVDSTAEPVNGSDAVFAAVAGAAWNASGLAARWPTMRT